VPKKENKKNKNKNPADFISMQKLLLIRLLQLNMTTYAEQSRLRPFTATK